MADSGAASHDGKTGSREAPAATESWVVLLKSWVAELIDPDAEWAYRRTLCREADAEGYRRGWQEGRRLQLEELAAAQAIACGPARAVFASLPFAVLEGRRWGPRGRAHFGDPREQDYPGGPVPPW